MGTSDIPVVIMAGGRGRRLQPFTVSFPKPLVPIGDMPIIEIVLRQLKKFGFKDITLSLGYLAELLEAYLSQNKGPISELSYQFIKEETPTGTAGSLGYLKDRLTKTFLVMNGDILTDLNYSDLLTHHRLHRADVTVATHHKKVKIEYGVLDIDTEGLLTNYNEKPVLRYSVAMGISVMEPVVLNYITAGEYLDIPSLLMELIADGRRVSVYHHPGQWLDIGNQDEYALAQDVFYNNQSLFNIA